MRTIRENSAKVGGMFAAMLLVVGNSASGQLFNAADVSKNNAIAASPRAIEAFPGLVRDYTAKPAVRPTGFLAASPRMLERYPALNREAVPASRVVPEVSNAALAASPRVLEQFPSLARDRQGRADREFEIAPLK